MTSSIFVWCRSQLLPPLKPLLQIVSGINMHHLRLPCCDFYHEWVRITHEVDNFPPKSNSWWWGGIFKKSKYKLWCKNKPVNIANLYTRRRRGKQHLELYKPVVGCDLNIWKQYTLSHLYALFNNFFFSYFHHKILTIKLACLTPSSPDVFRSCCHVFVLLFSPPISSLIGWNF